MRWWSRIRCGHFSPAGIDGVHTCLYYFRPAIYTRGQSEHNIHTWPRVRQENTIYTRGQSATCRGVKYVSSRGISGDFRNPTALVRVFLPPEEKSKNITLERDFYESLQRDFFWRFQKSHSSGPSFSSSRGNLKRLPPRGIFYISPLELSWQ